MNDEVAPMIQAAVRRPKLEVADVFHRHGADWRKANAGHLSLGQLQVMSAIEQCRSAALGGHVERCEDCGHSRIAYNSRRNRHCPKCQGAAAQDWLTAREADLLPIGYFHVVFTMPAAIDVKARRSAKGRTHPCFRSERSIGVGRTRTAGKGGAGVRGDSEAGLSDRIGSLADERTPPRA
jgi:hypothetical protein